MEVVAETSDTLPQQRKGLNSSHVNRDKSFRIAKNAVEAESQANSLNDMTRQKSQTINRSSSRLTKGDTIGMNTDNPSGLMAFQPTPGHIISSKNS